MVFVHSVDAACVDEQGVAGQRTGTHTIRADAVRAQVESTLGDRFAGAFTPAPRQVRETVATGIEALDTMLGGGLPLGAITEFAGPLCSGRTGAALSTVAAAMREGNMCAWVDASDAFDPESAAANGVALEQLLWVRCGVQSPTPGPAQPGQSTMLGGRTSHPARAGQHPRNEVRGLDTAVGELLREGAATDRRDRSIGTPGAPNRVLAAVHPGRSGPQDGPVPGIRGPIAGQAASRNFGRVPREEQVSSDRQTKRGRDGAVPAQPASSPVLDQQAPGKQPAGALPGLQNPPKSSPAGRAKPWARLDQALRATDLLLQAGGFRVLVLDLGSIAPEHALRIPLATWFRFRAAADANRTVLLALTQTSCARSSAGLVVSFGALEAQTLATPPSAAKSSEAVRSPGAEALLAAERGLHIVGSRSVENPSAQQAYILQSTVAPGQAKLVESIGYHAWPMRQRFTPNSHQPESTDSRATRLPQASWQFSAYPARERA